ncbi:MAG: M23 family metallopeptidase [Bradymonadaceae bacterium]
MDADDSHRTAPDIDDATDRFEWWARAALLLGVLSVLAWAVVWLRLGVPSVYAQVFAIPILGGLTLPVALWGLARTVFRPPVVRWRRGVAFAALLAVGFFGNVPLFAVPLATEGWTSEHRYRLPFDGEWDTLAGGPRVDRNYHALTAAYRWGYDFAPRRDGERAEGDGEQNADYYCFGRPVLAAAPGEVVRVQRGKEDSAPGEIGTSSVLGNHVVIRVDRREYLFTAHLKKGSLAVEEGERVERGERLGACGSSGRAMRPHLHVHLQTSERFPFAQGLPLRFSHYVADGERVDRGMPLGEGEGGTPPGQTVRPVE